MKDTNSQTMRNIIEGIVAIAVIGACAAGEGLLLFRGAPAGIDGVVLGKILGTLDAAAMIVLQYYFGSTRSSMQQVDAITAIGQAAANTPIRITMPDGSTTQTSVAQEQARQTQPTVESQLDPQSDNASHM